MNTSKLGAKVGLALAAVAVVVVAGFVAFGGSAAPDTPAAATAPAGPPAPDIPFEFLDGGSGTFADFAGQPVVVNFFADWCPACIAELPDFQAVHEQLGSDVVFLGLDRSTSDAGARALLEETGVTYGVALDREGALFQAFEGFAMPTTVFLNAQGEVVDRQNGVIFEDDLRNRLELLLSDT